MVREEGEGRKWDGGGGWGGGGCEGEGRGGVKQRKPPSLLPHQQFTSECARRVGRRAGWMERGGEGVGGNWRGVALTHQATENQNKTCGQGNGTGFLIPLSLYLRRGGKQLK